ncbi:hypothetical protein C6A37_01430 [Desulfobacteraceae bacterium SEEP-SAG9]|nr:hypothetical protein C6A37_01430 [Desulfobacteraceae bacterium SEEP-SAG9]
MPDTKIAEINENKLKDIQVLEKQLGDNICLVALEKTGSLFVLEAKLGPNVWERVDKVYPELENLRAYFLSQEDAHLTKSSLKKLLIDAKQIKKRPIRLRKIK